MLVLHQHTNNNNANQTLLKAGSDQLVSYLIPQNDRHSRPTALIVMELKSDVNRVCKYTFG